MKIDAGILTGVAGAILAAVSLERPRELPDGNCKVVFRVRAYVERLQENSDSPH